MSGGGYGKPLDSGAKKWIGRIENGRRVMTPVFLDPA
jgi:hypothetical protein